uniref:Uncharacterized protein n=1 Tax=Rhizophora mucronata TaxID=61149 RepID=A0A2P2PKZ1_RHIMU
MKPSKLKRFRAKTLMSKFQLFDIQVKCPQTKNQKNSQFHDLKIQSRFK